MDLLVSFFGYTSTSMSKQCKLHTFFINIAEHLRIMKKIKLYIATSIDGFIARPDGNLDWLMKYPINFETNYGYDSFYESIDTVVMGGRTYHSILAMDVKWPYQDKNNFIVTRHPVEAQDNIKYITSNIVEEISHLREETGKDIWLVGGGELVSILLNAKLIDEMIITTIPVVLGNGVPLFPNIIKESDWNAIDNNLYGKGVTQITYRLKEK